MIETLRHQNANGLMRQEIEVGSMEQPVGEIKIEIDRNR